MQVGLSSICGSDMHPYKGAGVLLDQVSALKRRPGDRAQALAELSPPPRVSLLGTSLWGL